jgi:uncharacterized protein
MDPQEQNLITTLLSRLKSAAGQPKEPEADALIRQAMAEQPDAPYYLVQTVLIQDLSLHNAQNRIAELEHQVTAAQQQAARPTSFLGGLFGSRQPAPLPEQAAPSAPAGPWTRAPQVAAAPMAQPYQQPGYGQPQPGYGQQQPGYGGPGGGFMGGGMGGGGFLRSAAATAAGIAGGALLFQGIESMFGRGGGGILGGQATPGLTESVIDSGGGGGQDFASGDAGGQDWGGGGGQDFASGDAGGQDDGGGQDFSSDQDFGGGQDQDFGGGDQDFGGGDFGGGGDNFSC